jgi:hypothetical protein
MEEGKTPRISLQNLLKDVNLVDLDKKNSPEMRVGNRRRD